MGSRKRYFSTASSRICSHILLRLSYVSPMWAERFHVGLELPQNFKARSFRKSQSESSPLSEQVGAPSLFANNTLRSRHEHSLRTFSLHVRATFICCIIPDFFAYSPWPFPAPEFCRQRSGRNMCCIKDIASHFVDTTGACFEGNLKHIAETLRRGEKKSAS